MPTAVRAIRGATTVDEDSAAQITARIGELLGEMLGANAISEADIISILFTATDDITALFPAAGAREFGFAAVPLMCARELAIEGAKPLCLRVMMHVNTTLDAAAVNHIYLHDTVDLRDDL
jgi:chorismate mutase